MPKATTGFVIANGDFYEDEAEANYEETKLFLHTSASKAIQVTKANFPAFLDFIEKNADIVAKHCTNYLALQEKDDELNIVEVLNENTAKQTTTETEDETSSNIS